MVGLQFAVGQIPYFDHFVPAARHNDGVLRVGGEPDIGNPFSVAFILDGVFALSKRVPQLDRVVSCSRHDLSVISRKGDAQHILSVSDKLPCCDSSIEIPKTQSLVPRTRESELSIR